MGVTASVDLSKITAYYYTLKRLKLNKCNKNL